MRWRGWYPSVLISNMEQLAGRPVLAWRQSSTDGRDMATLPLDDYSRVVGAEAHLETDRRGLNRGLPFIEGGTKPFPIACIARNEPGALGSETLQAQTTLRHRTKCLLPNILGEACCYHSGDPGWARPVRVQMRSRPCSPEARASDALERQSELQGACSVRLRAHRIGLDNTSPKGQSWPMLVSPRSEPSRR